MFFSLIIRIQPESIDEIVIYFGTFRTPVIADSYGVRFCRYVEFQVDKGFLAIFYNAFNGIFALVIQRVICIDFGFVFQIDLLIIKIVENVLLDRIRDTIFEHT